METAVHEYMVLGVFPSHFITPDFRPNDLKQNHSASDVQGKNERLAGEVIQEQLFRPVVWSDSNFEHENLNILVPGVQDIFEVEDTLER
ncbi:hypothetical protein E4U54_007488, partial [Claviceps lovelessii]